MRNRTIVTYRHGFFLDKNIQYLKRLVILHKNKSAWSDDFLSQIANYYTILLLWFRQKFHFANVMQEPCNN